MKALGFVLLTLSIGISGAQEHSQSPQQPPGFKALSQFEQAKVEEVFKISVDGYRFIAYAVIWHDQRVVVSDPLASTNYVPGDQITFITMQMEYPSLLTQKPDRVLSFQVFELASTQAPLNR